MLRAMWLNRFIGVSLMLGLVALGPAPLLAGPVMVEIQTENVKLTDLAGATKLVVPSSCVTQKFLDDYFGGCSESYDAYCARVIPCAQGHMQATILNDKLSDVIDSINSVDSQIARLQETLKYIADNGFSGTNLNGFKLIGIPAGEMLTNTHHSAVGMTASCVTDPTLTHPIADLVAVVGTSSDYTNPHFDLTPLSALTELKGLIDSLEKIKKIIEGGIGITDVRKIKQIAALTANAEKVISSSFIPVVDKRHDEYNYAGIVFSWREGKRVQKRFPSAVRVLLKALFKLDVPEYVTCMDLGIEIGLNGEVDGKTYKEGIYGANFPALVPEQIIFKIVKNSISSHLQAYEKLKLGLLETKEGIEAQLADLRAKSFGCD